MRRSGEQLHQLKGRVDVETKGFCPAVLAVSQRSAGNKSAG